MAFRASAAGHHGCSRKGATGASWAPAVPRLPARTVFGYARADMHLGDDQRADLVSSATDPASALTMEQHAGIAVALAEGFPRADVLAQEQIDEKAYRPADAAWKKRLVDDAAGEGKLFAAYQTRRAEAEDWLHRKVDPLDSDLASWLGFLKTWASAPRPFEILAKNGLTLNDVGRLGRVWERAFAKDDKLAKRAEKLAPDAKMPAKVDVAPRILRPFPWSPGAAPAPPPPAPVETETDAPPAEIPAEIVVQAVTPSYMIDGARPDSASPRKSADALKLPSYARNVAPDTTSPIFYLRGTDGLPFSPESGPSKLSIATSEPSAPARSGETALSVDISKMAVTPFEQPPSKDPKPALGTVAVFELPRHMVLPFAASAEPEPPTTSPAPIGETVTLDPALVAKASLPFHKKDHPDTESKPPAPQAKSPAPASIGETVTLDPALIARASLPFAGKRAADSPPPADAKPPHPGLGETANLDPAILQRAAMPFAADKAPQRAASGPSSPPIVSLLEHAALCAEIALRPTAEAELLARAGLDAASKARLDIDFQRLRAERPPADAAWTKAYREAYARLVISSWKGPPRT